ncbi:MAG: DoxX family protein [Salibacteraceae bacterium]
MLSRISRILVGSLFIVSGLIKANDPVGFSYKLNDYFAPGVFNIPWLDPWALELSILVCVAEIVLGVAVLFGARMKLASWSLLILMIFFTFLTGYTAIANWFFDNPESGITGFFEGILGFVAREDISYMKDCGCFGDAIKLTPWQSFAKDVVLLVFTIIIFLDYKNIRPEGIRTDAINLSVSGLLIALFALGMVGWIFPIWFSLVTFGVMLGIKQAMTSDVRDWIMAGAATAISLGFSIYCVEHLPIKDFRPYKIGNNIGELKECPPDAPQDVYEDTWFYKVDGEVNTYTTEQEPWNIDGAEFVDRKTELISKGCEPPIHDFVLEDVDGNDLTEDLLAEPFMILAISYDLTTAEGDAQAAFNAINEGAMNDPDGGPYMYGLAANVYSEVESYRHKHQVAYEVLTGDGTMLKTIIRSNPGLVVLKEGTVIGKWHYNDVPSYEVLKSEYLR